MKHDLHPDAPHHLPWFVTGPGETDVLLYAVLAFLIGSILMVGNLYFQLHSLPERRAHHSTSPAQFEIVAVLGLLALFTHNHLFWIAALLLAMVRLPDFSTPLNRIADSLERSGEELPAPARLAGPTATPEKLHAPDLKPQLSEVG
jgi:hypothetical protein